MIKNINVSTKITILILGITLVAVASISFFSYDYHRKATQEKNVTTLTAIADNYAQYFSNYFDKAATAVQILKNAPEITSNAGSAPSSGGDVFAVAFDMPSDDSEPSDSVESEEPEQEGKSLNDFLHEQKAVLRVDDIILTSNNGSVIASTDSKIKGTYRYADQSTIAAARNGVHFTKVSRSRELGYYSFAAGTTKDASGNEVLILIKLNLSSAYKVLTKYYGLGTTGEVIMIQRDQLAKKAVLASPLRSDTTTTSMRSLEETHPFIAAIAPTFDAKNTTTHTKDYDGNEVLLVSRRINTGDMALVAKMNLAEVNGNDGKIVDAFFYASLCVGGLAVLLAMIFSRSLTRPLFAMRTTLNLVAQGVLPEAAEKRGNDEFGQMGAKVDHLVQTLRGNAEFAKRIGEGKYDTEFKPASDDDILGMSLITMRNNLIENERRDTERNWIVRGVAEISEILRMHDAIDELGDDVIKFILGKIGAIQGAFYVVNDEVTPHLIEMRASFAYNRKKYLKAKFKFAEGLVGQAAIEKDTILRTEIPSEYVTLTSGILGDQKPSCILIVPLITNEEVYGVLEFASFKKFDEAQVNFVKELSLILARTIFNIKVNERTRRLLAESQAMSN